MTPDQILNMAIEGEGLCIEFKSEFPKNAWEIAQDIAAFANTSGGTILMGVDDRGNLIGISDTDKTMQGAANSACKPPIRPEMGRVTLVNGTQIVWVKIRKQCEALCMVNGKCYIRSGPSAIPVEDSAELKRLLPHRTSSSRAKVKVAAVISLAALVMSLSYMVRSKWHQDPHQKARGFYELGLKYEATGDDEQAITALNQAASVDSNFGRRSIP